MNTAFEEVQKAAKTCLSKYADFSGRAARPEFWWFVLAQAFIAAVLNFSLPMVGLLFSLGVLLPTLAAGSRRLHDTGKSGWLQLIGLVPVLGWAVLIYLTAQPGNAGVNAYDGQG